MKFSLKLKSSKKNRNLQVSSLLIALLTISLIALPVQAADTAAVTATVTVQNISVAVSDGTISYGTLALNTSAGTNGSDTQTATNDGNVTEDFNIKGQDTANWTLAGTAGANQYVHQFCTASCASAPTNYTPLTTNYQTLASGKIAAGNQTFDMYLSTPTSTSSYTQQNVDITVQAALP